jgi:hypothetical protein
VCPKQNDYYSDRTLKQKIASCGAGIVEHNTYQRNKGPNLMKSSRKSHTVCLPPAFTLVSCSAYSSTLKMEVPCSSETSVDFQWSTRRYFPEDITLHTVQCPSYVGRTDVTDHSP